MEDVTALSDDDMPVPGGQKGGPGTTPQVPAKLVETPTAKPSPKPEAKQVAKETTPKAKAKGKSKAKATPKSKGSKTAGSNETEGVGRETPLEVNDGGKPSKSMKRPACSAEASAPNDGSPPEPKKRPAANQVPQVKVNKYIYHRDGVVGIKRDGKEIIRVGDPESVVQVFWKL